MVVTVVVEKKPLNIIIGTIVSYPDPQAPTAKVGLVTIGHSARPCDILSGMLAGQSQAVTTLQSVAAMSGIAE